MWTKGISWQTVLPAGCFEETLTNVKMEKKQLGLNQFRMISFWSNLLRTLKLDFNRAGELDGKISLFLLPAF